jgi:hypothetical protein
MAVGTVPVWGGGTGIPKNNNPQLSWQIVSFFQIGKTTKHNEQIRKTLLEDCHITFPPLQTTTHRAKSGQ